MVENAKAIGEAAAHGDLSENAEYRFALERRDMLRSRLAVMQEQMLKARILDPDDPVADHVTVGSRVRLARVTDGSAVKMTLLGPWDADPAEGVYNYKAPLCRNVLGRRLGETVHLDLDGEEHAYRIEHIESGV
jgi:transcription elongation GreA/GreB family factor